jgi:hypothetical protein
MAERKNIITFDKLLSWIKWSGRAAREVPTMRQAPITSIANLGKFIESKLAQGDIVRVTSGSKTKV